MTLSDAISSTETEKIMVIVTVDRGGSVGGREGEGEGEEEGEGEGEEVGEGAGVDVGVGVGEDDGVNVGFPVVVSETVSNG